jgi:hypothetical protein
LRSYFCQWRRRTVGLESFFSHLEKNHDFFFANFD